MSLKAERRSSGPILRLDFAVLDLDVHLSRGPGTRRISWPGTRHELSIALRAELPRPSIKGP